VHGNVQVVGYVIVFYFCYKV